MAVLSPAPAQVWFCLLAIQVQNLGELPLPSGNYPDLQGQLGLPATLKKLVKSAMSIESSARQVSDVALPLTPPFPPRRRPLSDAKPLTPPPHLLFLRCHIFVASVVVSVSVVSVVLAFVAHSDPSHSPSKVEACPVQPSPVQSSTTKPSQSKSS